MSDSASVIWRDHVTDGVPASGAHKPAKSAIRDWGARVEAGLSMVGAGDGGGVYTAGTGALIGYLSLRDAAGVAKVTIGSGDNTTGAEISFHDGFPGIDVKNGWLRVAGNAVLDAGSRPDGSQAVAEAGTDTTLRTWTAAHIKAAILALTPAAASQTEYISDETTITLSSTLTFAHGLGVVPKVKQAILRCKTADLNYAVGDEIDLRDAYSGSTNAAYASGAAADATNIKLIMRYAPALINKSAPAGSPANIDTAKWKLVVRAWA